MFSREIQRVWYDERMEIRRGDNIRIVKGMILENDPERIRATVVENLTSGVLYSSRINSTFMMQSPVDFDPPVCGRVDSIQIGYQGTDQTHFTIIEGVWTDDNIFVEAGDFVRGQDIIRGIISNELAGFAKICDTYVSSDTITLLSGANLKVNMMVLCHTPQDVSKVKADVGNLVANGFKIVVRVVTNKSDIHSRYILTSGTGWAVGHCLKDFGRSDSDIRRIPPQGVAQVEKTFDRRWMSASIL